MEIGKLCSRVFLLFWEVAEALLRAARYLVLVVLHPCPIPQILWVLSFREQSLQVAGALLLTGSLSVLVWGLLTTIL
jgi:hypothetical protein